ncbi:hypothetical protein ACH5RR_020860 [Cinchona calisaya]|uniref:Uncharacterized protein n=1 Tax=Cinchona calisaya TaxID=153742 RepID=A0ABD2ZFM2_9GENT
MKITLLTNLIWDLIKKILLKSSQSKRLPQMLFEAYFLANIKEVVMEKRKSEEKQIIESVATTLEDKGNLRVENCYRNSSMINEFKLEGQNEMKNILNWRWVRRSYD